MPRNTISSLVRSLLEEEVANCCPLCGKFERTENPMNNHHINHDPEISEYWNLIRLCEGCHEDLTNNRHDGERERRVGRVKRTLFRRHFGPEGCNALIFATENGMVTCSPVTALMLVRRGYLKMHAENVLTVGPATNISTLDTYQITPEGRLVTEKLKLGSLTGV